MKMIIYFSGYEIRARPEHVLDGRGSIMLSYGWLYDGKSSGDVQRFKRLARWRKKQLKRKGKT
jgi:hypothetical protein